MRKGLVISISLAGLLLAVLFIQIWRNRDLLGFLLEARSIVVETRELADRAATWKAEDALAALAESRWHARPYRFEEALHEARVEAPPARELKPLLEFDGTDAWELQALEARQESAGEGPLRLVTGEKTVLMARHLDLLTREVGTLELRVRLRRGGRLWISWSDEDFDEWPWHRFGACCLDPKLKRKFRRVQVDVVPDDRFHTYRLDLRGPMSVHFLETMRTLFIHPSNAAGDEVELDYVRFHSARAPYLGGGAVSRYVKLGKEVRPAIGCVAPCEITYEGVGVPLENPVLELGLGLHDAHEPLRFEVHIVSDKGTSQLLGRDVSDPRWHSERVSLARWTGQSVTFKFALRGVAGAVGLWSNPVLYGAPRERFNVLFVVEDALRADHLSIYGHERRTSPTKEALAATGVVFEHAFSQGPNTCTSAVSFMTSHYPAVTGIWNFLQLLDDSHLTLAEVLRSQGFLTASMIENGSLGYQGGLHQGFASVRYWDWGKQTRSVYTKEAPEWIAANRHRNWFLYLHVFDPHGAYDPDPPFDHWYREGNSEGPVLHERRDLDPDWMDSPTVASRRLLYDGEIEANDHWFAELLGGLEKSGQRDRTLIVFASDHGEHLGEHHLGKEPGEGEFGHHAPTFRSGVHVPLVLSFPPALPPGTRVPGPVALLDVMPTILDLAGISAEPLLLQGRSLVPQVEAHVAGRQERRIVFAEEPSQFGGNRDRPRVSASVFYDQWHLLASRRLPGPLRFHFIADPDERRPLAEGFLRERLVRSLAEGLLSEMANTHLRFRQALESGEEVHSYDPEHMEDLRALGYLE